MRSLTLLCCILNLCIAVAQTKVQIINYNVENLFHPNKDSINTDEEFTADGERHWTYSRYQEKLVHIGQVVANIGEWDTPAIVGLEEVEDEQCLQDLCKWGVLRNYKYNYLHQNSKDVRGIDCALLYHPKQFDLLSHSFIPIPMDGRPTRDIIYASGRLQNGDTLHLFVCHFPSQRGGSAETNNRRETARTVLQTKIDSLIQTIPTAKIVIMGDFNSSPEEQFNPLHNLMIGTETEDRGTYKWKGIWSCLDHFYVSSNLLPYVQAEIYAADWLLEDDLQYLGTKPKRTYYGYRYNGGYSDHLPIRLLIHLP